MVTNVDVKDVLVHLELGKCKPSVPVATPTLDTVILGLGIVCMEAGLDISVAAFVDDWWGMCISKSRGGRLCRFRFV